MQTFKDLIQRIQSLYSKGVQSDDSRLESRQIYAVLLSIRAKLLEQKAKKKQKLSAWTEQTIPCVKLVKAPMHECPCLPVPGCSILKSEFPLPVPLSDYDNSLISSVTSLDGKIIYSATSWTEKKYKKGNKYTGNKPDYYIRNNYLYVTHTSGPRVVSVTGVFTDPFEVTQFPSICDEIDSNCEDCQSCDSPLDMEVPIDPSLVETLINMSYIELLQIFNQNIEDLTNDTKDNIAEQSK